MSDVDLLLLDDVDEARDISAIDVLRRGVRRTPGVRRSMAFSVVISLVTAAGRLALPVLVQQVIDRGLLSDDGYRPDLVLGLSAVALGIVALVAVLGPTAETAMVRGAQEALYELRRAAFAHIHRLSLADQSREKKGVLLARVTIVPRTVIAFKDHDGVFPKPLVFKALHDLAHTPIEFFHDVTVDTAR